MERVALSVYYLQKLMFFRLNEINLKNLRSSLTNKTPDFDFNGNVKSRRKRDERATVKKKLEIILVNRFVIKPIFLLNTGDNRFSRERDYC